MDEDLKLGQVLISTDSGRLLLVDVLYVAGEAWLVSKWHETPDGKSRRPTRAIRVTSLLAGSPTSPALREPVPMAVLDGPGNADPATGRRYEVLEAPASPIGEQWLPGKLAQH